MQIQQLRYFLEVAKTLNITEASKNLIISQPSLSQQIINLEKELGVPLLIRRSRSVELTDAGEQFAFHARRILGGIEQLSELMQKHSLLQEGTLRVGMLWIAGYLNLFQVMSDYSQRYPGLSYDLKIDGRASLLDMVLNHSLHAAFLIGTENRLNQHKELYFRKILEDKYVAVVSVRNPLSRKKLLTIEDFRDQSMIMPAQASSFRKDLDYLFDCAGITPRILCETSQSDIVLQIAGHNLGVGFSSSSIARSLRSPDLAIIPLDNALTRTIYYVTLKELLDYPSIRSFTDFITHYNFSRLRTP